MITSYDELISRIASWSNSHGLVQATIMVGSRAGETKAIDPFSDLDLILFSDSPSGLARSETWISTIAQPWVLDFNQTFAGDAEWQVIYEGGFKVDYVITNSGGSGSITQTLKGSPYLEVFDRGWKQLYLHSEEAATEKLPRVLTMPTTFPASVRTQLTHGLFLSFGLAKSIFRNDLWRAHNYLSQIRAQIMWFIEIRARSNTSRKVDTWDDGRYIDQWADHELIKRLPNLFPGYDQESLTKSFHFALGLLDELALDVSTLMREDYPTPGQQSALKWLYEAIPL